MLSLRSKKAKKPAFVSSTLLPEVFAGFDDQECINVLDVGTGQGSTLDVLKQLRCRVFFVDLFSIEALVSPNGSSNAEGICNALSEWLNPYAETLFDVCLFWDLLNRLEPAALQGLSNALEPYIYSQTKGYGVCALNAHGPEAQSTYKIQGFDQLQVVSADAPAYRHWSHSEFTAHFDSFQVSKDTLSVDGRLELLLAASA